MQIHVYFTQIKLFEEWFCLSGAPSYLISTVSILPFFSWNTARFKKIWHFNWNPMGQIGFFWKCQESNPYMKGNNHCNFSYNGWKSCVSKFIACIIYNWHTIYDVILFVNMLGWNFKIRWRVVFCLCYQEF